MLGDDMSNEPLSQKHIVPVGALGNVQPLLIGRIPALLVGFRRADDDLDLLAARHRPADLESAPPILSEFNEIANRAFDRRWQQSLHG